MADIVIIDKEAEDAKRTRIADAIRSKGDTTAPMEYPEGFIESINAIETMGGAKPEQVKTETITANGKRSIYPDAGYVMSACELTVNVPMKPEQEKTKGASRNGSVVVTPDPGKVLSKVTVNVDVPNDTTDATATDTDVLSGKTAYLAAGKVTGKMPINPAQRAVLDLMQRSITIPAGYHDGNGTVEIWPETRAVIPSKAQNVVASNPGKVLAEVIVQPIPEQYVDTTSGDALATDIRAGKKAWVDGKEVTGTFTPKPEQVKTAQAVKNGPVTVTPDPGKTLSSATVNVDVPSDKKPETAGSEIIKANGKTTFNPPAGGVFSSFTADVQVPIPVVPEQQEKEVTITKNGDYPITPDVGKVLSKVLAKVNVSGGGGDVSPFKTIEVMTYTPVSDTQQIILEGVPKPAAVFLTAVPTYVSTEGTGVGNGYVICDRNELNGTDTIVGAMNAINKTGGYDSKPAFAAGGVSETVIISLNKQTPFKAGREYIIVCFRM